MTRITGKFLSISLCMVAITGEKFYVSSSKKVKGVDSIRRSRSINDIHRKRNIRCDDEQEHTTTSPTKPSFLFILADDVGWSDLSYNGGIASTPNIDEWAGRNGSIIFQDFHSGGTVCSPTRATVLTGRNHFRDCVDYVYGCPDMSECMPKFKFAPLRTYTVGDAIRATNDSDYIDIGDGNGGASFFAGKWHLGSFYNDSESYGGVTSSPLIHGFDHMNATLMVAPTMTANCQCNTQWESKCDFGHYHEQATWACRDRSDKKCCFNYWWDDPLSPHGVSNLTWPVPDDDALYLADSFDRFVFHRKRLGNKPFLAQVSFHNCHIPFIGSKDAKLACEKNETCIPPETGEEPYNDKELDYYACISQFDQAVGQILQSLSKHGYYDNTMIWLSSDNGPEMNCPPRGFCKNARINQRRPSKQGPGSAGPLRGRKRDIYEGGHRVPGVLSWPAVIGSDTPSRESWETVVTTDFLPTIMDILNVDRPSEQRSWAMDGQSILPLLINDEFRWEDTPHGSRELGMGFFNANLKIENGWGYRYGRWKYVEGSASCKEDSCRKPQLFDLVTDMGETNDLSKKHPKLLATIQKKFRIWHRSVLKSRKKESKCHGNHDLNLPPSMGEPLNLIQVDDDEWSLKK